MEAQTLTNGRDSSIVFVITGPSGVGKGTVVARLLEADPGLRLSVSATTREPREGEEHGRDYWFMQRVDFLEAVEKDAFFEHAEYCGQLYGTPRSELACAREAGQDLVLEIEVQGARQARVAEPTATLIMVIPPSRVECERRLMERGTESAERVAQRMHAFDREVAAADEFDYVVVNDEIDRAVEHVRAVIVAERLRASGRHAAKRVIAGLHYNT